MTSHFQALVPDGVFVAEQGKVRFEALGPPTQCEVERLPSNHGVFAPGAKLGPWVRPGQQEPEASQAKAAGAEKGAVA